MHLRHLALLCCTALTVLLASIPTRAQEAPTPPSTKADPTAVTELLDDSLDDDGEATARLARIRLQTREYASALELWQQVLDEQRQRQGRWSPEVAEAHTGIAASLHGLGRFRQALEHYDRALYVYRMNHGLHDPEQVPLLDRMTEVNARLQQWEVANELQQYAHYLYQREHGEDSPELLPSIERLAEWYEQIGATLRARELYEQAIEILEQHEGPDSPKLVDPLRKLAETYRQERFLSGRRRQEAPPSFQITTGGSIGHPDDDPFHSVPINPYGRGQRALERAVELQQADPQASTEERVELTLELADWYLLFDRWNQALDTYRKAQSLAAEDDPDTAADLLDRPVPLVMPIPPPPLPEGDPVRWEQREGYVEMRYDVSDRGHMRDLEIIAADPEDVMDIRVRRALRDARFRPRFESGEPVDTEDVHYRHAFNYLARPTAPDEAQEEAATGEAATGEAAPDEAAVESSVQ